MLTLSWERWALKTLRWGLTGVAKHGISGCWNSHIGCHKRRPFSSLRDSKSESWNSRVPEWLWAWTNTAWLMLQLLQQHLAFIIKNRFFNFIASWWFIWWGFPLSWINCIIQAFHCKFLNFGHLKCRCAYEMTTNKHKIRMLIYNSWHIIHIKICKVKI